MVVPQSLLGFEPFASDQKPIWGVKSSDESGSIHSMAVEPVSKRCISANRTELGAEKVPRRGTLTRGKHLRGKSRAGCHKIPPHSRVINNPTVVSGTPKKRPHQGLRLLLAGSKVSAGKCRNTVVVARLSPTYSQQNAAGRHA